VDWKSTAIISSAGILATWFFSMPPTRPAATGPATPRLRASQTAAATIDIEQEAARLQAHMHQQPRYIEPSRNPFRFGSRPAARPAAAPVSTQSVAAVPQPSAPPRIALDGIAVDNRDGQEQRTAILNTDIGIVLVREGEEVAGYRVDKIGADLVQLVKVSDGSVLSVGLR
jgi:hypothetical protein